MEILYGAKTDVGLKRLHNEDYFFANSSIGLYVVCDGMGGVNAGEVASALAVETIQQHVTEAHHNCNLPMIGDVEAAFSPQTNRLASALRLANRVIYAAAGQRSEYAGMGTTVVAAWLSGGVLSLAHVGDSRLYLVRDGVIQSLTTDHSVVADQIARGLLTEQAAERSAHRHVITRALGIEFTVDVDLDEIPVMCGDRLLLCSDGLTRAVPPTEIARAVRGAHDPQAISDRLIAMANEAGGEDNTTVILILLREASPERLWHRLRNRFAASTLM